MLGTYITFSNGNLRTQTITERTNWIDLILDEIQLKKKISELKNTTVENMLICISRERWLEKNEIKIYMEHGDKVLIY